MTKTSRDTWTMALLWLLLGLGACMLALSGLLITLEYDEAWILASLQGKLDASAVPLVNNVLTTGGVHHLVLGLVAAFGVPLALAGRVFSAVCLVILMLLLDRRAASWGMNMRQRLIVALMVLAAPGTLFLGAMAYGVLAATLFFVLALLIWTDGEDAAPTIRRAVIAGVCLGLAAATRWTFLPLLPLFVLFAVIRPAPRLPALKSAVVATIAAGLVFAGLVWLHDITAPAEVLTGRTDVERSLRAAGLSSDLLPPPARMLAFVVKYFLLTPMPLALAALSLAWFNAAKLPEPQCRFLRLLVLSAILVFAAWVLRSPFQHTRYIWPSVVLVFAVAGFGLAVFHDRLRQSGQGVLATLVLLIPIGLAGQSYVSVLRLAAVGASFETNAAGQSNLENHYKPLHVFQQQQRMVTALQNRFSPQDRIMAIALPADFGHMQLSLLTGRNIGAMRDWGDAAAPDFLLVHQFSSLDSMGEAWLSQHAVLEHEIMNYRIFRLSDAAPPATDLQDHAIGLGVYRYTLPRYQSLSSY